MRRPSTLFVILSSVASVVAALLLGLVISPGNAAGAGPDTLTITEPAPPATYEVGQSIKVLMNINEDGGEVFASKLQVSPNGTDSWTDVPGQSGTTTEYGRITFTFSPTGDQYLRGTWSNGTRETEHLHLQPQAPPPPGTILPNGPDTASLTENPTTYSDGDQISLVANFPKTSNTFPITLYKETAPDEWSVVATKTSNSSGDATFTGFPVTSATQKVFARKANNDRSEVDLIAPTPKTTLSVRRDCPTSSCGDTATAYGELKPAQEGRLFKLQYKNGSSWSSVVGATPTATGADGKVQIQFPVGSLTQWSTRTYRITSDADADNLATTSNEIQFMPGPTQLGKNVLHIDVDKGIYPSSKGPVYPGKATLSEDGVVKFDHVDLESFGVRGTSTAKFTKKAYKVKFINSLKPFGITKKSKSWTLLAMYLDRSGVRDKVGLELGRKLNAIAPATTNGSWTPQSRYVEMFVNDQYRGAYLLTESVKIDGDRVDVDETQGMIMETNGCLPAGCTTVEDTSLGFKTSKGNIFAFKDPDERKTLDGGGVDPKGVTSAKLSAVKQKFNDFEAALYSSSTREQYPDFINVDSAIDFYLVKEFTKDRDSFPAQWDPKLGIHVT